VLSNFEQKKCRLCSRFSSALNGFFFRFFGRLCCSWINRRTHDQFRDRVASFNACAPRCACEAHPTSRHSSGVVEGDEIISRFVFSPLHVHRKTGAIMPNLFSHAERQGCSVQRELANNEEIASFVRDFLKGGNDRHWLGVVSAYCSDLRAIRLDGVDERAICIYDTAEPANPAHAEVCWSGVALEEGDSGELRKLLLDAFSSGSPVSPAVYRSGDVLRGVGGRGT
jgi:hypothetical protein